MTHSNGENRLLKTSLEEIKKGASISSRGVNGKVISENIETDFLLKKTC
jgi:hypothetical protein